MYINISLEADLMVEREGGGALNFVHSHCYNCLLSSYLYFNSPYQLLEISQNYRNQIYSEYFIKSSNKSAEKFKKDKIPQKMKSQQFSNLFEFESLITVTSQYTQQL